MTRDRIARRCGSHLAGALVWLAPLAVAVTASAQPVSSFVELGEKQRLKAGDAVTVEDAAGRRHQGKVQRIDGTEVTLRATPDREALVLPAREVVRITRRPANRVALGAIVGAGAGLALTAAAASSYGRNEGGGLCSACLVRWSLIGVPIGAGAGALIGMAAARAGTRTVFVAGAGPRALAVSIAPVVAPRLYGAVFSVRF